MNRDLKNIFQKIGEYILDEENILFVFDNSKNAKSHKEKYVVIHYKNINGEILEVNRWFQECFWHHKKPIIFNQTLLIPYKNIFLSKPHNRLYDFKKGEFVFKSGDLVNIVWNDYECQENDCFIAYFFLYSKNEHIFEYYDPFAYEKRKYSFNLSNKYHFAILNWDGTIRDNKIFIGFDKENIEKVVDFTKYSSLEDYKTKIITELEEDMRNQEKEFYQSLQSLGETYKKNNNYGQEFIMTLSKKI